MTTTPATLLCDFYKVSHREQYPPGTQFVYSTWTPRSNKYHPSAKKVVVFGGQAFIKKYLIDYFNANFFGRKRRVVEDEYRRYIKCALGVANPQYQHITDLWRLGYLPLEIKSLPEGSSVPLRCPMMTVVNTDERFFWVTNFIETLFSCNMWQTSTSATIAQEYRSILDRYATETVGNTDFVPFQGHDFSMRGMGSLESAQLSGAGHLLSFVGTDTIPAISFLEAYYNADIETDLIGTSIPATEHSVMCAGGDGDDEYSTYDRLINDTYPSGYVSIVSDTWDLWGCVRDILPRLKDKIMARDGKVVIRPDSGDPVEIICGIGSSILKFDSKSDEWSDFCLDLKEYKREIVNVDNNFYQIGDAQEFIEDYGSESFYSMDFSNMRDMVSGGRCGLLRPVVVNTSSLAYGGLVESLWGIFGGTVNEQGYKVLDPHIGAIYGDSITLERCEEICKRLKAKGFASTNMVYGIGSYTYQFNTRDTFGFAFKSTAVIINGKEKMIYKNPKTDDGTKKSNKGAVAVIKNDKGEYICIDELSMYTRHPGDQLETIFLNGEMKKEVSLQEIRDRVIPSK